MGVPSLTKQIDAWCPHCKSKKSCAIYETRPQECRDFFCGYRTDRTLGDEWKPSVSKFIMVPAYQQNRVMVHVDPDRPEAWRQEPYYSTLMNLARKAAPHRGQVFIRIGAKTLLLTPQ
jgi:Fe-S-cluster containining protein